MKLLQRLFPPASRDKFARRVITRIQLVGGEKIIKYDPDRFLLLCGSDGSGMIYLGNFYQDYSTAPFFERKKVFERYLSAFTTKPQEDQSFEQVKINLLPRVRERFYYQAFELNMRIDRAVRPPKDPSKSPMDGFVFQQLNDQLTLELAVDLPDAIRTVGKKDLQAWGMSFDDAMKIARDNLWRASNKDFVRVRPGLFVSPWSDTHDASRLYLHDLIWQLPVKGDHVAAVPNRNVLIVTGSDDHENLQEMARLIDVVMQQPRPMTADVFRLTGSQWTAFLPPADSPAFLPLQQCAQKSLARDYAEQADLLNTLHQKTNEDVFVAKHSLMKRDDGTFWSWACWVDGVTDALMPRADFINFGSATDQASTTPTGFARWERVVEIAGDLMIATDMYPPRYRIRAYPSDEQLAALDLQQRAGA